MGPYGLVDLLAGFFVGDMLCGGDARDFHFASHFHGLDLFVLFVSGVQLCALHVGFQLVRYYQWYVLSVAALAPGDQLYTVLAQSHDLWKLDPMSCALFLDS